MTTRLPIVVCLLALPALATADTDKPRLSPGSDASRQVSVTWNTDAERASLVEYRSGAGEWIRVQGSSQHWDGGNQWVHSVWLEELEPGSAYTYRVGDGQQWSAEYSFGTAPSDGCTPFRFVVLGDERSQDDFGPDRNWAPILTEALAENPAFILNGGDLIMDGDDAQQWSNWVDMTDSMFAEVGHLPTIGNHDDDRIDGDDAHYNVLFELPRNDVTGTEDYYYVVYGDLIVVSMSTTTFKDNGFADQAAWLDRVLLDHPVRWKVVFFHHPVHTMDLFGFLHPPNEEGQNPAFVPVFDRHHVDLVVQSHNHWYERTKPSRGGGDEPNVVDDESMGTVYVTSGGAGAVTADLGGALDGLLEGACNLTPWCDSLRGEHHYIVVDVLPNELRAIVQATATQLGGDSPDNREVIDQFTLTKRGDERIACDDPPPAEGEGEGPPPVEGEGEGPPPVEGEGEGPSPVEGEGEGPSPAEGEGEGEGSAPPRGEGEGEGSEPPPEEERDGSGEPAGDPDDRDNARRGPIGPDGSERDQATGGCACEATSPVSSAWSWRGWSARR